MPTLSRYLAGLMPLLWMLPALSGCSQMSASQGNFKAAQDRAEAQLKVQGESYRDYIQIYDAAMRYMEDPLNHPEQIRDDSGEGLQGLLDFLSYAPAPRSPGRDSIEQTLENIASNYERLPSWEKCAGVRGQVVDFATRWDLSHHVFPEDDWRIKLLRIRYADSLVRWGTESSSVDHVDAAMREMIGVIEKPQSIETKYIQDVSFDATPPAEVFGPEFIEQTLDNIAVAYKKLGCTDKAADTRRQRNDFTNTWDASHEGKRRRANFRKGP